MGNSNDVDDPELILNKLKSINFNEENTNTLNDTFRSLNLILTDYKFYNNILEKQTKIPQKKLNSSLQNKNSKKEISKTEIINMNGKYTKQIIIDIYHIIERIKKWVKMVKTKPKKKKKLNKNIDLRDSFPMEMNNMGGAISVGAGSMSYSAIKNNIYGNKSISNKEISRMTTKLDTINENDILNNCNTGNITITQSKKIILNNYNDKKIEIGIWEFFQFQSSKFIERLSKGPPDCFRWVSWCVINNVPIFRDNETYNEFLNKELELENKNRIIRDIQRTFNCENIDQKELRKKETSLYNVLKAFWNIDREIGYCQGMNLITGFLLTMSDFNERDTFYFLISYFSDTFKERKKYEYNFRGLFSEEFPLLYFFNYIFDNLLKQHIPSLQKHMEEMGITDDLWIGQWFQTAFTIILPIKWCKRVWDNIFSSNIFFLVKFSIAFCEIIKDDLLCKDEAELMIYFKDLRKNSMNINSEFYDKKSDINLIIIHANKIKINIDDFIKNYQKLPEREDFTEKMEILQEVTFDYTAIDNCRKSFDNNELKSHRTILFTDIDEEKAECLSDENDNNTDREYLKNNLINKNSGELSKKNSLKINKRRKTRSSIENIALQKKIEEDDDDYNDDEIDVDEGQNNNLRVSKIKKYQFQNVFCSNNIGKFINKNRESAGKLLPHNDAVSSLIGKNKFLGDNEDDDDLDQVSIESEPKNLIQEEKK